MLIVKDGETGKTFKLEPAGCLKWERKPGIDSAFFGFNFEVKIICTSPEQDPLFLEYYTGKMCDRVWNSWKYSEPVSVPYSPWEEDDYEKLLAEKLREQGCEVTVKQEKHEYEYNPNVLY